MAPTSRAWASTATAKVRQSPGRRRTPDAGRGVHGPVGPVPMSGAGPSRVAVEGRVRRVLPRGICGAVVSGGPGVLPRSRIPFDIPDRRRRCLPFRPGSLSAVQPVPLAVGPHLRVQPVRLLHLGVQCTA
ncbi:hypothetical protein ACFFX0_28695 [Citricoccus parietis]|uniref:Uncharacterized protein n=1 Tax=Citricoccus parietis TaxID=592307 RepID=A0ABV5G7M5_9MICC